MGLEVSLIVPAYNEEKRILKVLEEYTRLDLKEIIVVCNGCTDDTPRLVSEFSKRNPKVKMYLFNKKLGKGGAILEGFLKTEGEIVGFVDSDESTTAAEFNKLVTAMKDERLDGAIGSRRVLGAEILVLQPLYRRIFSKVFNILVRGMFGLDYRDTQCGVKAFTRDAIMDIVGEVTCKGFEFDVELLWRLKKKGYRVLERPIVWSHRGGSTFSLAHAPKMFVSLLKIRLENLMI